MKQLPEKFITRLQQIIPETHFQEVLKTFSNPHPVCARINTLKISKQDMLAKLDSANIPYEEAGFYPYALKLSPEIKTQPEYQRFVDEGLLYPQNFSSMLPVIILDPKENETVLDACAAPGSKTSQLAMHMNNSGVISAVDAIPKRVYKLRSVLEQCGVKNVDVACCDVRHFDPKRAFATKSERAERVDPERALQSKTGRVERVTSKNLLFDKILVDAPCSSEGRFHIDEPKSFAYWSERKIKEMAHKQKGILLSASRLLKSGGRLVYSTCSFSPDENEEVIDWFLRKSGGEFIVEDIEVKGFSRYPSLREWGKRILNPEVSKTLRVLPDGDFEGFFVAKFRKV